VKLKAKWLVVACAPFALHFCPQRRWSRQINWITCVLWTETVTNHCYVNRQINRSNYQQVSNCCRPVLTYWPTHWCHQWLTDCWSCTAFCCDSFSLLWQLCTVGHWIFLYGRCKQLSVGELHTHTRLMALCPGLPRWAGTRKVKPIWILLKQETVSGSGISWTICKSAPHSREITMPAPYHSIGELNNAYFSRHLFSNNIWVAKSCTTVCFTYSLNIAIFWTQIFHKVVLRHV